MEQKYLYAFNGVKSWLGGLGFFSLRSRPVDLLTTQLQARGMPKTKLIWRNRGDDMYSIGKAFEDNPLELSNYLLIRTREHFFLRNKSEAKLGSGTGVAGKVYQQITPDYYKQSLKSCELDLEEKLKKLQRLFRIKNEEYEMPVAFATNALYILARNGMIESNDRVVADKLIPLLHEKKDWLHGEGVAQAVYALEQSENYDTETWALLKEKIQAKDFDYLIVKQSRLSALQFETLSGSEHLLQADNNEFTNQLFYQDKLNLYELYNSVKAVAEKAPHLQLESTIASLESKYPSVLEQNDTYLELNQAKYEPKFLLSEAELDKLEQDKIDKLTEPASEESK